MIEGGERRRYRKGKKEEMALKKKKKTVLIGTRVLEGTFVSPTPDNL